MKDINNLCAPGEKLNDEELEQIMAFNEIFDQEILKMPILPNSQEQQV